MSKFEYVCGHCNVTDLDLYLLLGVEKDADVTTIRAAYRYVGTLLFTENITIFYKDDFDENR